MPRLRLRHRGAERSKEADRATCGQVTEGLFGDTLGPCTRDEGHRADVAHRGPNGETWWIRGEWRPAGQ